MEEEAEKDPAAATDEEEDVARESAPLEDKEVADASTTEPCSVASASTSSEAVQATLVTSGRRLRGFCRFPKGADSSDVVSSASRLSIRRSMEGRPYMSQQKTLEDILFVGAKVHVLPHTQGNAESHVPSA